MTEAPDADPIDRGTAPAVSRAVDILALLASSPKTAHTLSDIAREIGAAKSSTRNVCNALEAGGLIQRRDGGYQLGRRMAEFGGAYISSFDQVREFYRVCADSEVLSHELVQVAVLEGMDVLYLARHEGRAPLLLSAGIGDRFPAALTAVGNALLATLSDSEVRARFAENREFPARTERSIRNVDELLKRLTTIRRQGYAVDLGGVHPAVIGIAAAVPRTTSTSPAFAVGVSLIAADPSDEDIARYGAEVHRVAEMIALPGDFID